MNLEYWRRMNGWPQSQVARAEGGRVTWNDEWIKWEIIDCDRRQRPAARSSVSTLSASSTLGSGTAPPCIPSILETLDTLELTRFNQKVSLFCSHSPSACRPPGKQASKQSTCKPAFPLRFSTSASCCFHHNLQSNYSLHSCASKASIERALHFYNLPFFRISVRDSILDPRLFGSFPTPSSSLHDRPYVVREQGPTFPFSLSSTQQHQTSKKQKRRSLCSRQHTQTGAR